MKIWELGLDFSSADLDVRSKVAASTAVLRQQVLTQVAESVILSTCNRVEVYGCGEADLTHLRESWMKVADLPHSLSSCFRHALDREALAHLFRVSSSMESMVIGEAQILGQTKRAYEQGIQEGSVGPILHKVFQRAFKVAKRVRIQTEVGRLAVSIPSIGVKLAEKVLGDLSTKKIGIIGLGEIGRVAAEHFASVQPESLILYNRTRSTAEEIAAQLAKQAKISVADDLGQILDEAEVIVSAVDALLIREAEFKRLNSRGIPILLLDLSVPPSVEKMSIDNVFSFFVDDLQAIAVENNALRKQEVEKAGRIIDDEADACWKSMEHIGVSQTFDRLASQASALTNAELQELRERLGGISPQDWNEIEKMAHRLTSKLLQVPMVEVKSLIQSSREPENILEVFRNLFRL